MTNQLPSDEKLIEIIKSLPPWDYLDDAFEAINKIVGFTMNEEQQHKIYHLNRYVVVPEIEKSRMAEMGFIPTTIDWLEANIGKKVAMIATGGLMGDNLKTGTLKRNGDWYIVMPPRCSKRGYSPSKYIKAA
jgi:hypothetical protein